MIILSLPLTVFAQHAWHWEAPTKQDAGNKLHHQPVTFDFPITNLGNDTLFIDNIRTDCSCTTPEFPLNGIPPGQTANISIRYDAAHRGSFRKKITVWFRKVRRSERLYIYGRIV